jgi:hypothetical protein
MKSWKQIKRNLLGGMYFRLLKDTWHWRKGSFKSPKFFYEVEFNKPGGMMMILLITYEDGTVENFKYPAQIWRKIMTLLEKYMLLRKQSRKFKLTLN